jgi:hypothetical protein
MARRADQLTTGEVADICGVAPRTVGSWFDTGKLKGWRIPGSKDRRISLRSLVAFMKENGMDPSVIPNWRSVGVVVSVGYVESLPADCGFEVHHVSTMFDAGAAYNEHRPDCVLVDAAIGRIDSILIAQSVRPAALCVAIGGRDDDGLADAFDAIMPPSLTPAEKAEWLRLVVEGRDEERKRETIRRAS